MCEREKEREKIWKKKTTLREREIVGAHTENGKHLINDKSNKIIDVSVDSWYFDSNYVRNVKCIWLYVYRNECMSSVNLL